MTTSLRAEYSPSRSPWRKTRGLEQHAVLDDQLAAEVRLQRGKQLVDGQGGEKAETAQVDTQNRNPEISHQSRHGQQSAVAAQDEQEIGLGRQLRAADHRSRRLRAQARGLLLEDRLDSPRGAPLEQLRHDGARLLPVRLGWPVQDQLRLLRGRSPAPSSTGCGTGSPTAGSPARGRRPRGRSARVLPRSVGSGTGTADSRAWV